MHSEQGLEGVDLAGEDLSNIDLHYADLRGADLRGKNLSKAHLCADLRGADLREAILREAEFWLWASLGPGSFGMFKADLGKADLSGADLTGAEFHNGALLRAATLRGTKLSGVSLSGGDLSGANLSEADLRDTKLAYAKLNHATLAKADLSGAYLYGADLSRADLREANLHEANLTGADLDGADLRGAKNFCQPQVTRGDVETTKLPDGLKPPLGWILWQGAGTWNEWRAETLEPHLNLRHSYLEGRNLQAARLEHTHLQDAILQRADLQYANLQYANLQRANLQCVDLQHAKLQGANLHSTDFWGADLRNTNITEAHFQDASFVNANLQGANFQGIPFQNAQFKEAKLQKAIFQRAKLKNANFKSAKLQSANLRKADLQNANLQSADLQSADLRNTNLQSVDLQHAKLQKANLKNSDLQNANLWFANLTEANLRNANLQGANLRHADLSKTKGLSPAQLTIAFGDAETKLPTYVNRPKEWERLEEEERERTHRKEEIRKKIFISYSQKDADIAKKLHDNLDIWGYKTWIDLNDLPPGQTRENAIQNAIKTSGFFIALLSTHSVTERGIIQEETKEAISILEEMSPNAKKIIPARINNCNPKHNLLRGIQCVDIFPDFKSGFKELMQCLPQPTKSSVNRFYLEGLIDEKPWHFTINNVPIKIGRSRRCDIVLPSKMVSSEHALITEGTEGVDLCDLESTNGTAVNGHKISCRQKLSTNDIIEFGDLRFVCTNKLFISDKLLPQSPEPPPDEDHIENGILELAKALGYQNAKLAVDRFRKSSQDKIGQVSKLLSADPPPSDNTEQTVYHPIAANENPEKKDAKKQPIQLQKLALHHLVWNRCPNRPFETQQRIA